MTLLYRSPDVLIDGTRWHLTVQQSPRGRRPVLAYRFHTAQGYRLAAEAVRIPKGLARTMAKYRKHAEQCL